MSNARVYTRAGRSFRSLTTTFLAPAAAVVVLLTGLISLPSSAVSGATIAHASGASAPCIATTTATGPPGGTLTISDAIGSSGYWWGNAVQQFQALALGALGGVV